MKKFNKYIYTLLAVLVLSMSGCEKFYDINKDPDALVKAPLSTLLTSTTVNIGYFSGSDLNRYAALMMQQFSGQSSGGLTQTQEYDKYLITGQDSNNLFSTAYANIIMDLQIIIDRSAEENSPHYSGVAKVLKAYMMHLLVDAYGDLPYSEAFQMSLNPAPKYDNDEQIYTNILALIDEGISEMNQGNSSISPGTNSTIYSGSFTTRKSNWIKFANTLKLRLYLRYSEKDPTFLTTQMNNLISSGAEFFTSNADNFKMDFLNVSGGKNPFDQMESGSRANYLVPGFHLVNLMNLNDDPRRQFYFTSLDDVTPEYVGAVAGAPANPNIYSKMHTYLRGQIETSTYGGEAPIRMLSYAEYNFIRAEAALRFGVTGDEQVFFEEGIRASLAEAGVSLVDQNDYIDNHGTLTGTDANKLKQIIEQKYVASYGVIMEPWTDWRRTGYPVITIPSNAVISFTPRSLYYPQSEVDTNPNIAGGGQKANMGIRVFWDTRN